MKNSKGFALLEALLIFVIIGALAGVGWYVYQRQNTDEGDDSYTYGANTPAEVEEPVLDETAEWTTFTPDSGLFSVKVPDGWTFEHGLNCDCLFTKTSVYSQGTPATITDIELDARDGGKGLIISYADSVEGTQRFESYTNQGEFTTSGLTGTKYYFQQTEEPEAGIGVPKGGYEYYYVFEKDGQEIYIGYIVYPGDDNQLELVEKSVKSLQ